ncbi:hypothetical protein TPHA_0G00420 [Tetrapisispora phaffii CBS 4417]|uniref:Patatin-like phospholipase domain-containing protein n=1 Tax=Tetrapisispora phaffii (strain ATCC 24235 / CBS 4417 / NBRC 1672 / NRRL Y-8282 / UCD 70-5) TaxID=1071381 RepID=G8BVF0_TETPH|nr:hypothetical protein TPHA_0G00420 [Tetrapisispora phaffii CBS 4417]CCE63878.1 hypothetical protein TPHA_0G00420 [Tetrapisispora phaffii CBS 4417]
MISLASLRYEYPITQKLIEKYYENILGQKLDVDKDTKTNSAGKDTLTYAEEDDTLINENEMLSSRDNNSTSKFKVLSNINTSLSHNVQKMHRYINKLRSLFYSAFIGDYEKDFLIQKLLSEKFHSMSYDEWKKSCLELDKLTDTEAWKEETESSLYDYKLIQEITEKMRKARLDEDYSQLVYIIRTNWVRDLGNMGNVNLYRNTHIGTKKVIDNYIEESKLAIEALINSSDLDDVYLLGMLQQTRRNIGRTALVLSGGGTFGLFHIGVLSTLSELDLLPKVISGSSAGAIVASILSVYTREEIPELFERILNTDFNIFKDDRLKTESENLLIKISRFFKNGTWFSNQHLIHTMKEFLGDLTFREAYNRTGKILNITVSPASIFEQPRLLNNLTAPNVMIWSAVCASCSLPGIFPSSQLYEKDPVTRENREWNSSSVKYVDGSVDNDLPISRLSEMFNVDHIIACQVNIHVFPMLKMSLSCVGGNIQDEISAKFKQKLGTMYYFFTEELIHYLEIGCEIGMAKNLLTKLRSVLSQQYSGDITILPNIDMLFRINELLANPSKEFILRETVNGARATWPKISIIQNHCGQEFALEKGISYLKGKILISSSIRNPLQFSEVPVGLVPSQIEKFETESSAKILDDNLLETEPANSLLLLPEELMLSRRFTTTKLTSSRALPHKSSAMIHRRKSDTLPFSRPKVHSKSFTLMHPASTIDNTSIAVNEEKPLLLHGKTVDKSPLKKNLKSILHHNEYNTLKEFPFNHLPNYNRMEKYIQRVPQNKGLVSKIFSNNVSPRFNKGVAKGPTEHNSIVKGRTGVFFTESDNDDAVSQRSSVSYEGASIETIPQTNDIAWAQAESTPTRNIHRPGNPVNEQEIDPGD